MTTLTATRCANCGHAQTIHVTGSVCGAMHCYCRAFVEAYEDTGEPSDRELAGRHTHDAIDEEDML